MVSLTGILKGIALFILSFLLFTSLTSWTYLNATMSTALDASFVAGKVKESQTYDLLLATVTQQMNVGATPLGSEQEMKALIQSAFSREWFNTQVDNAVADSFAYLKSEKPDFKAKIDFMPVKQSLADQLNKKIKEFEAQNPGVSLGTVSPEQFSDMPDSIDFAQSFPEQALVQARTAVSFLYASLNYLLLAAVVFLALIALIHRNLKKTLKWFGSNLAISGATLLILAYFIPSFISTVLSKQLPSQQQQIMQAILPLMLDFFKAISDKVNFYAIIFVVAGIILYVAGRFVIGRFVLKEKNAPATKEKTKPKK
jgi:hypothetical protein